MMDEPEVQVEKGLRDAIRLGKIDVLSDPARFASLLDDLCPKNGYSSALKHAVRLQVHQVLLIQASSGALEPLIHSSAKRLHLEEGIDIGLASWAVRLLVQVLQSEGLLPKPKNVVVNPLPPVEKKQKEINAVPPKVLPHCEGNVDPKTFVPATTTKRSGIGATIAIIGVLTVVSGVVWAIQAGKGSQSASRDAYVSRSSAKPPAGMPAIEPQPEQEPEQPKSDPNQTPAILDSHGGEVKVVPSAHFSIEVPEGWTFSGPDSRTAADVWTVSNGSGSMVEIHYPHSVKDDPNNTAEDLQEYPRTQADIWKKEAGRNYHEIVLNTVDFAGRRVCVWEYTRMSNTELVHRHTTYLGRPYGHAIVLSSSEGSWSANSGTLLEIRESFKVDPEEGD